MTTGILWGGNLRILGGEFPPLSGLYAALQDNTSAQEERRNHRAWSITVYGRTIRVDSSQEEIKYCKVSDSYAADGNKLSCDDYLCPKYARNDDSNEIFTVSSSLTTSNFRAPTKVYVTFPTIKNSSAPIQNKEFFIGSKSGSDSKIISDVHISLPWIASYTTANKTGKAAAEIRNEATLWETRKGSTTDSVTRQSTIRQCTTEEQETPDSFNRIPNERELSSDYESSAEPQETEEESSGTSDGSMFTPPEDNINVSEDERENHTDEYDQSQEEIESHVDEEEQSTEETENHIREQNQTSVESEQTTDAEDSDNSSDEEPDGIDRFLEELFCPRRGIHLVQEYSTFYSDAETCHVTVVLERQDKEQEEKISKLFDECVLQSSHKLHFRHGCRSEIQKQSPMDQGQGDCDNNNTTSLRPGEKLYLKNSESSDLKHVLFTGFYSPVCKRCSCKSVSHEKSCIPYCKSYMITCAHAFDSRLSLLFDSEGRELAWPSEVCHKVYIGKEKKPYAADLALLQERGEPLSQKVNRIDLPDSSYRFEWTDNTIKRHKRIEVKIVDQGKIPRTGFINGEQSISDIGDLLRIHDNQYKAITKVGDSGAVVLIPKPKANQDVYLAIGMVYGKHGKEGTLATDCIGNCEQRVTLKDDDIEILPSKTGVERGEKVTIYSNSKRKINGTVIETDYTSEEGDTFFRIVNDELEDKAITRDEDRGSWVISREPVSGKTYRGFGNVAGHAKTFTLAVDLTKVLQHFNCEDSKK